MPQAFDVVQARAAYLRTDELIAALAALQHGVVGFAQLIALGVSREAIRHRVATGRLHRLYRGVYAVGHTVRTIRGRYTAAVLACGDGAVLSHRAAAAHLSIRRSSVIEVTTPVARRARKGIRLHTARLEPDEHELVDGIPTTTTARTLLDLAAILTKDQLEAALAEADYLQRTSFTSLAALAERYPRRAGTAAIRALIAKQRHHRTRTQMERDYLTFCDGHGIPRPDEMNVCRTIHGRLIEADAVYVDERVIIELDGGSHMTRRRFHGDRSRDRANLVDGWPTVRVTDRHLDHERAELAADLAALLAARASRATVEKSPPRGILPRGLRT